MIELHGLTARQVKLLDIIWNLDTKSEVDNFISDLLEREQEECLSLAQLISIEIMDMAHQGVTTFPEANSVINHIRSL